MIFNAKELILLDTNNNTVVAAAKSIEINVKCDTVERTSANNSLFREYITGRKDWNFQISSLVTIQRCKDNGWHNLRRKIHPPRLNCGAHERQGDMHTGENHRPKRLYRQRLICLPGYWCFKLIFTKNICSICSICSRQKYLKHIFCAK